MTEKEIAKLVVDGAFRVHAKLGSGIFETVYEATLAHELRKRGLKVARQVPVPIEYDGLTFDEGFRADIIVEDKLIIELKSSRRSPPSTRSSFLPTSALPTNASAFSSTSAKN